tara:strand:- start:3712 stop:4275 length:564 start_codon:yes stop_codon:yes gene_type:complete
MWREPNISEIRKALYFAIENHSGQFRKFSGLPYVHHPIGVAKIVRKHKKSKHIKELIIAALLHDIVEDTDVTIEMVREIFGEMVASIVHELTSDPILIEQMGKPQYLLMKMLNMTSYALVGKLSDRSHNCEDLGDGSEKFRKNYVIETRFILNGITDRHLTKAHLSLIKEINNKITPFETKKNPNLN